MNNDGAAAHGVSDTAPSTGDVMFSGNKTTLGIDIVESCGAKGATSKDIDAACSAKGIPTGRNFI